MINYRFRIIRKLGAGGSGSVFLGEDTLWNNEERALKVLSDLPDSSSGETYLAEISVLLSLRHPHLVTLYDADTVRQSSMQELVGRRFFAMEFVKGGDALAWARTLDGEARAKGIPRLLAQCLSVLSCVHANNVIHADIKPQNILVSEEPSRGHLPTIKLTDFGYCRMGRSSDTLPARGTLEYAAPEVLKGEASDNRIDLYSLGATIYHLVEGRCPFESDTPVELIKKILTEDPPFANDLWCAAPELTSVVRSLLSRDPEERVVTAEDVAGMLGTGGESLSRSDVEDYRVSPFVGREAEKQRLQNIVTTLGVESGDSAPSAALVVGPQGIGKTRLVEEVVRAARISGRKVLTAEAVPGDVPWSSIAPLLKAVDVETRSFAEHLGVPPPGRSRIVKRFLGDALPKGETPEDRRADDVGATVEALARFAIEGIGRMACVLVAEDLDGMDESSMRVFHTIARDTPPGKGVLLVTAVSDSCWPATIPGTVSIPLAELTSANVITLTQSVLGAGPGTAALGEHLHATLGGTPTVILEALGSLRAVGERESIRIDAEAGFAAMDRLIPRDVDRLYLARFSSLTRDQQLVFSLVCCFEKPAAVRVVCQCLPFTRERALQTIRQLAGHGFLAFLDRDTRVAARIGRMKAAVYESVDGHRQTVHRSIVEVMLSLTEELSVQDLQELGFQYTALGEPGSASEALERAAACLLSLKAFRQASAVLSCGADAAQAAGNPDRAFALRSHQADSLLRAGMAKEAADLGTALLATTPHTGDVYRRLLRTVSVAQSRLGEFTPARSGLRELLETTTCEAERAELAEELINIDINLGGFKDAEAVCMTQFLVAERLGDEDLQAALLTDLGIATFLQGRYEDAAGSFERALGIYERLGNETQMANALLNLGNALNARGDSAAAITHWDRALEQAASTGTKHQEAKIRNNLGIAHFNLRQFSAARTCYTQSRGIFQRLGSKSDLAYTLTNLGEVMLAEGDYGGAFQSWTEAMDLYAVLGDTRGLAETSIQLTELHLILGNCGESVRLLTEAQRLIDAEGIEPLRGVWSLWSGVVKTTQGDYAGALPLFLDAQATFESSGEARKSLQAMVRIAECTYHDGELRSAVQQLDLALARPEISEFPQVRAEALYLLGMIEQRARGATGHPPLVHFKTGLELLQREPIGEITWKLTYALAKEFFERGQRDRASQHLLETEKILRYLTANLPTENLRSLYRSADGRARVLANIERHSIVGS